MGYKNTFKLFEVLISQIQKLKFLWHLYIVYLKGDLPSPFEKLREKFFFYSCIRMIIFIENLILRSMVKTDFNPFGPKDELKVQDVI